MTRRPILDIATAGNTSGDALEFTATITLPDDAAIAATGLVLSVDLPDGATVSQAESAATQPATKAAEQYTLDSLQPGGIWVVKLTITGAGSNPVLSTVEADQVSAKAGDPVNGAASAGGSPPTGSGGAWGLGALLLLIGVAGLRRR